MEKITDPYDVTSEALATALAGAWDAGYSACCEENSPDGHHLSHRVPNPFRVQAWILGDLKAAT